MPKKVCTRKTAILTVCFVVLLASTLSFCIAPSLLKSEVTYHSDALYPDLSFDELCDSCGAVEYCSLIQIEAPTFTVNETGAEVITTDYVFESLQDGHRFILRFAGGAIGNTTMVVTANGSDDLSIGSNYILFMTSAINTEETTVNIERNDVVFNEYYKLYTAQSSIFEVPELTTYANNNISLISFDGKYTVSRQELLDVAYAK